MSTFLSKLFKPKWQHKNKTIRLEAIESLEPTIDQDLEVLHSLAGNDPELEIRKAAIEKIAATETLIKLHQQGDEKTKPLIEERLHAIANTQSLSIFDLITDITLLTDMIVAASNPDVFINGLARIQQPQALLTIATKGKTSRIRQAAAELLESEQELKILTQSLKSKDKGVYHIAKLKLDRIRARQKQTQALQSQAESLVESITEHASTENLNLYDSKLESLLQRWETAQTAATEDQIKRFDEAASRCQSRAQTLINEEKAKVEAELLAKAGGDEQQATLLTLEETLNRFRETPASTQEYSALDAIVKTQENRWIEATRHSAVEKGQSRHYQTLMTELRSYLVSLRALSEQGDSLATLIADIKLASDDSTKLAKLNMALSKNIHSIDWPNAFARPEILQEAEKALGITRQVKQQQQQNAAEITAQLDKKLRQLDGSLEDKQIKASSRLVKDIQSLLSQLGTRESEKFHAQLSLRTKQLNELRDWQGFASTPRQTELCDAMERLAEQSLPPQDKAIKIKEMQKEWKSLGGASDEALWLRFKSASDLAYEPCKAYNAEQDVLKSNNLQKRQTLIEQLSVFVANNDWQNADWKAADQINRKAREEWRAAFPVDHKANRSIQKQFNKLLDQLDEHLAKERARNLILKEQIVEKALALISLEDLDQAINSAKSLQKDWQDIGITEHKKDRVLWKSFRQACDQVFARRDQARESRREEADEAIQHARQVTDEIKTFISQANDLSSDELKKSLDEFRKQNKQLAALPRKAAEQHSALFETLVSNIKDLIRAQQNIQRYAQWQEASRKSLILTQRYLSQDNAKDAELDAEFASTMTLKPEIETRMKESWISLKAGALNQSKILTESSARQLCIRCEIAAGLESPEQDKDLRMQLQVTRLSEGMSSSDHLSREEQLTSLLADWFSSVGLSTEEQAPFDLRVQACIDRLFA